MCARVTKEGSERLTLRSGAPLPRPSGKQQQELPSCRIIVERYSHDGGCNLGFVPSHGICISAGIVAAVVAKQGFGIQRYGGWSIKVDKTHHGVHSRGWRGLLPRGESTYATTDSVPPVPEGGAVGFAVDYSAGTCRVAFYTPEAVAGGFAEAPYAKMELRFEDAPQNELTPARPVPTAPDSGVELYPAVETLYKGASWRFAA
jgi:hypothetical protein